MELIEFITGANVFLEDFVLFRGFKFIIGIIVVVLVLDVLLLMYVLLVKDRYYRSWSLGQGVPNMINTMKRRWSRVIKMVASGDMRQQKDAVIESGNMVYEMLENVGHEGASLDEMLEGMVGPQLANIDDLKNASRVKNTVVNDEGYELSDEVAMTTIKSFGEALAEHKTIDEIGLGK
jgi:hypothetical protein